MRPPLLNPPGQRLGGFLLEEHEGNRGGRPTESRQTVQRRVLRRARALRGGLPRWPAVPRFKDRSECLLGRDVEPLWPRNHFRRRGHASPNALDRPMPRLPQAVGRCESCRRRCQFLERKRDGRYSATVRRNHRRLRRTSGQLLYQISLIRTHFMAADWPSRLSGRRNGPVCPMKRVNTNDLWYHGRASSRRPGGRNTPSALAPGAGFRWMRAQFTVGAT